MPLPFFPETVQRFIGERAGRNAFTEYEVKAFLQSAGLPVPRGVLIPRDGELPPRHGLLFPLVAKLSSSQVASKSDLQGVRLNIQDEQELLKVVSGMQGIAEAEGVLIEEMAPGGIEVVIGGTIDSQFGPVVMFGLGGIFVEVFRDVVFCLAPMGRDDAQWLIGQLKGSGLLEGYRGSPPVDRSALADIMISVAEIMATGLVKEITLNPVAIYPEGAMILDAKMQIL